ncbi:MULTISPECIES: hypothetical protein [Bacillales]|uniref:Uncharacterized protein n=1 Tax=Lysinibacillus louembei TaxID=1470088 RepID=A0ABZ0RWV6_9BACI|nr:MULTISPECIES: hypothetical protein [Bacillales]MCT6925213.1 hypothetical protein [Metasolibacillus sp.]MCT6941429.1 hypothetical protein [Metasolibacillus sp.]WPK12714.1 hypothetical protein R6U77_03150 [Lysinibacillus louembei]
MGRTYSAQNIASYIVYELNETYTFVNAQAIQLLLANVEKMWMKVFGHSAFLETTCDLSNGYIIKEVYDAYTDCGSHHIDIPAKEWFLRYGEFQLIQRTYAVPAFTALEEKIMQSILQNYRSRQLTQVS